MILLPFLFILMLRDKKIIIGISGSIAAYKIATLIRLLKKQGARVQVIMTEAATQFIPTLTLSTLSGNPVYLQPAEKGQWNNHVTLTKDADLFLIAPASANTLAKMRTGICDNMLLATFLSATCPIFIAPAMDLDMWRHPATKKNIQILQQRGIRLLDVEKGELASGLYGEGRMAEPEHIINSLTAFLSPEKTPLNKKKVLITAGPTYEAIDPVRFIGNYSSGKMGIALAKAFLQAGATVELVLGPTSESAPESASLHLHKVTSTEEMKAACDQIFSFVDIAILAAAVSDYRPAQKAEQKIKKSETNLTLDLKKNPDILQGLGTQKTAHQILAGFAIETENEQKNALAKLKKKNLDFIVLNSLNDPGAGFQADTNKVTIFDKKGEKKALPLQSKKEVAQQIIHYITRLYEPEN